MKVTSLASGSSGNCTYIESGQSKILIDAGISCKRITGALAEIGVEAKSLSAILVTHEHSDHIKGIKTISNKNDLPVYATEKTWEGMGKNIQDIADRNKRCLEIGSLEIGGLKIEAFPVSHDAGQPVGFSFYSKKQKVGYATDTGYVNGDTIKNLTGADFLFIESNHDIEMLRNGAYPWHLKKRILSNKGHLSNVDAAMSLTSLISGKTKKIALAHLSEENNTPDLAELTVQRILKEVSIDIEINVAGREILTQLFNEEEEKY